MKLSKLLETTNSITIPKTFRDPEWKKIIKKYKVISYIDNRGRLHLCIIKDIPASITKEKWEELIQKYCEICQVHKLAPFSQSFIKYVFIQGIFKYSIDGIGDFNDDEINIEMYPFKTLAAVSSCVDSEPHNFMGVRIVSFKEFMEEYIHEYVGENDFS